MCKSKMQEILDQAIKTPSFDYIAEITKEHVKCFEHNAIKEEPFDYSLQMAKELGAMRAHYQHDIALLIGHIVEINKTSNKL